MKRKSSVVVLLFEIVAIVALHTIQLKNQPAQKEVDSKHFTSVKSPKINVRPYITISGLHSF